ncbi:L-glyceraldehyde 3-phosphate reductase, partial [Streptomyces sp. SID11233]|nr:L-glyceraldehyde 3-phosphate reductase [Streptomyces sp. SID11233]
LALSWVLRDPRMTSALIGASSTRQLDENVAAVSAPALTGQELERIDALTVEW